MQAYSTAQPVIIEPMNTHPILTLIGIVVVVIAAYWIIASMSAKKGKKPSPKTAKANKKGYVRVNN